jgi:hypothetical protein
MKSNPAAAPFESPFDRLTVLSNAEGLTAQREIEGRPAIGVPENKRDWTHHIELPIL